MRIALQTMTDYPSTLELARWAEEMGLAGLSVADHYLADPDPASSALDQLVVLGGIARETKTIELSTLVSPLTFRHPAVMWKQAVTLDEMSGGRFTLGVGTGWMEEEHAVYGIDFPPQGERFARLEESLSYLRALMADQPTGFEGRFYRLDCFVSNPRPRNLRLAVGGGGAVRTPTLAGRFADEFNIFPSGNGLDGPIEVARAAAADAGRDPSALVLSTAFPAVVGTTRQAYESALERTAAARNRSPDSMEERLVELGIPHGTPEQVGDAVDRLADLGIELIHLQVSREDLDDVKRSVEVFTRL